MRKLKSFCKRLFGLAGRGPADDEFKAELESHLEMHIEDNVRSGMTREEARRQAILKLGGLEQAREAYRERLTIPALESLLQDARFGSRILTRKPGFAIVVVIVLALGIGANTAMFSIVDAVLLRPLPYRDSDRLTVVWQSTNEHRSTGEWFDTYREFQHWQRDNQSFEKIAALTWAVSDNTLVWRGKSQSVLPIPVSLDFFSMLGVNAAIGRVFQQSDLNAGCSVVLSHSFWQNELGAPADLVGQSIPLDQKECTVIGVMPKDFSFYPIQAALWTLITPDSDYVKDPWRSVTGVFGRLKPGISRTAAESELASLEQNILPEAPRDLALPQSVPVVLDLQSEFTWLAGRNLRTALIVLLAAVFLVLLIACVDVANLLLGHATDRQREIAIRASLGAGRSRIIRQLLIESTLLSAGGALLGALLAFVAIQLFREKNPIELPPGNPIALNWQVLAFTAALAVLSVVLFGLVPAWNATRLDLNQALKEAGRNASQSETKRRSGSLLIAGEVALSLMLLTGAGLLIQSLARLAATPLGFRTDHLLTALIQLPKNRYSTVKEKAQFFERLTEQTAAIPGVTGVSIASNLLPGGSSTLSVQGRAFSRETATQNVASETLDGNFMRAMGIPVLKGRTFDTRDRENTAPVAIVNQALADKYFPNQDPIGEQIKLGPPDGPAPWLTIVGVVGNVKTTTVFQEMGYVVRPCVYLPLVQKPPAMMSLLIRTNREPRAIVNPLREKLSALDNEVTLANVKTMDEWLTEQQSQPRFRTILLSVFAALALILAALGIYGVLTQSVMRRRKEIGVRMALGATRERVMRMVLAQALRTVLVGIALGLVATLILGRTVAGLLYNVKPANPWTLSAVSVILVFTAVLSSYLPARRATTVDPLNALRSE